MPFRINFLLPLFSLLMTVFGLLLQSGCSKVPIYRFADAEKERASFRSFAGLQGDPVYLMRRRFAVFRSEEFERLVREASTLGRPFSLELFDDVRLTLQPGVPVRSRGDFFLWKSRPTGNRFYGQAQFVFNRQTIQGLIQLDATVYEIKPVQDNIVIITETDQSKFPTECPKPSQQEIISFEGAEKRTGFEQVEAERIQESKLTAERQLNILLVLPRPAFEMYCGSSPDMRVVLSRFAELHLTSVFNSPIESKITAVVETACYDYEPVGGNFLADLQWLTKDPGVAALRDKHEADLVSMLVPQGEHCGKAWRLFQPLRTEAAFSVVKWDCAYSYYTLAHEIGHNLGMQHDRIEEEDFSRGCNYGHIFDFTYKWLPIFTNQGRTIMAYGSSCNNCLKVGYFSTPTQIEKGHWPWTLRQGPLGIGCEAEPVDGKYLRADNRRQLINGSSIICEFR